MRCGPGRARGGGMREIVGGGAAVGENFGRTQDGSFPRKFEKVLDFPQLNVI